MKDAFASRFAGGGYAASVAALTLGNRFHLLRNANDFRFFSQGTRVQNCNYFSI